MVMMMKISKSKRQLAQLLIEAGVTQFPNGANWAAQDKDFNGIRYVAYMYVDLPTRGGDSWSGLTHNSPSIKLSELISNWHQTKLSRAEFDQIVAEAAQDADGWIEWGGAPRGPVSKGAPVDVKMQNGTQHFGRLIDDECWSDCWGDANIIAYRQHKPEQVETVEYNDSVASYTGPVQSEFVVDKKPALDQLLQDWRNADDLAKRKQEEAGEAAAMRDERWQAAQERACEMGVTLGLCESVAAEHGQAEPVMTGKFRNTKIGSPKSCEEHLSEEVCDECGRRFGQHFGLNCKS